MKNKKGISLIVLIITIIVVIILAAVVILTLSKNNPIESAKEARFKEDVRTFQDELALYISKQYANAGGQRDEKITTSDFDEIKEYIPSFNEKYRDKFVIQDDNLRYTNQIDEKEKEYVNNLNLFLASILPKEYQQVEYIEGKGSQYIDTQLNSHREFFDITVDFQLTKVEQNRWIFGTRAYEMGYYNGFYKACGYKYSQESDYLDRTLSYIKAYMSDNNSFYIFARNWPNDVNEYFPSKVKIYSVVILSDENLIRHFVPCYRKSDNVKGLYDTVEGKFYTNQGDPSKGDFIPGPDVN